MNQIKIKESDQFIQLTNGLILFQFNITKGTYDIINPSTNKSVITDNYYEISMLINGAKQNFSSVQNDEFKWESTPLNDSLGKGTLLMIYQTFPELQIIFKISLYSDFESIFVQISINPSISSSRLVYLKPFVFNQGDFSMDSHNDLRILKNDWQSWSPIEVVDLSYKETRSNLKFERRGKHAFEEKPRGGEIWSHYFSVIKSIKSKEQLFFGFTTLANQDVQIRWKIKDKKEIKSVQTICFADSILLEKAELINSEILMISISKDPIILERWAEITGTMMKRRISSSIPFGWCSWYQYYKGIDEQKIKTNLQVAQQLRDQIPLEYFQIDDGYEPRNVMGDWLEADPKKFPKGLENLAQQIKDAGFKPGIWLAPFLISNNSKLYKEHNEWILKSPSGKKIWGSWPFLGASSVLGALFWDRVYALDLTNPQVQAWLKNTIVTLVKEFGFTYLKIDFIYAGAIKAVRYNPKMTRIQAYRKGLEIIREAAGEETFILGCGAPYGPAIGIVDAMRVSTDTAPTFKVPFILNFMNNLLFAKLETIPSVENAMQQNILRYFFHNHFWINDPDTLIVRHNSGLSINEIRFEVTVIGLLGGLLLISDNMANYSSTEIELIQSLNPPSGITARPLYMLEENYPSLLVLDISTTFEDWKLIGVLNWSNKETTHLIDLNRIFNSENEKFHVFEFWERKYLGIQASNFHTEPIKAHSAKLYALHKDNLKPILLSSTFHITQGGIEVKKFVYNVEKNLIELSLEKTGSNNGQLYIYLPDPLPTKEIMIEGDVLDFQLAQNILKLEIEFQNKVDLLIKFKD